MVYRSQYSYKIKVPYYSVNSSEELYFLVYYDFIVYEIYVGL